MIFRAASAFGRDRPSVLAVPLDIRSEQLVSMLTMTSERITRFTLSLRSALLVALQVSILVVLISTMTGVNLAA